MGANIIEIIWYFFCFFPYVKWLGIDLSFGGDLQMYSVLFSCFVLLVYGLKRKVYISKLSCKVFISILVIIIASLLVTLFKGGELYGIIRYICIYLSFLITTFTSYIIITKNNGIGEKIIKLIININLVVGLLEKFVNRTMFFGLIQIPRTTSNRGEIGLAAEPSFYGYMCVFLILLAFNFKSRKKIYITNLLIQIVFIAQSGVTMLMLAIYIFLVGIYRLIQGDIKKILPVLLGILAGIYIITKVISSPYFSGSRYVYLIRMLVESKDIESYVLAARMDGSMLARFNHIYYSLLGFIKNIGMPGGFSYGKVQSGYGMILLTGGIIGIYLIIQIYKLCSVSYDGMNKKIVPVFITIVMFSSVQISNPVWGYLIGYFMWKSSLHGNEPQAALRGTD